MDVDLIYELWQEYVAAANDNDLERWVSLWVDDGVQMPPDGPRCVGKEQIQRRMRLLFEQFHSSKMNIHPEEIQIVGRWAYSHGTYEFEMVPKGSRKIRRYSGKFLDVMEKQGDGSWKIAVDCHNYDTPSEKNCCRNR